MLVCSTAGISYDLDLTLEWMDKLDAESFEFMIYPECNWDLNSVAQKLRDYDIKSVHGNRDIGTLILKDQKKGIRVLEDNLDFMHKVNADFLVIHAWDPRNKFNIEDLLVLEDYRDSLAIENIPSVYPIKDLFDFFGDLKFRFTLDLAWLYFSNDFRILNYNITNVHVRDFKDGDPRTKIFKGNVKFERIFKKLGEIQYTFEAIYRKYYKKPEEVNKDLKRIREILNKK